MFSRHRGATAEHAQWRGLLFGHRDQILRAAKGVEDLLSADPENAVNAAVSQGLADAMDRLNGDPGLSVAILTGAGGSFCAGMDLKAFTRGEDVAIEGRGMGFTERPPVEPLIAAVDGYAHDPLEHLGLGR